jgi:hypothetical protein
MAATGPDGNCGRPSPPGAVFFVAMLVRGPVIVSRITRFTTGCPACCPKSPARPGTTAGRLGWR